MSDQKKHKPMTTVVFEDSSPMSSRVVNPHEPEFVEGYEKEETKQACLEAFEKHPPRDPKDRTQSQPYQRLRDAHMLLVENPEYRARQERAGDSLREDAFDDPAVPPKPIEIIEGFRYSVGAGLIPNPNALIFAANGFAAYLESKGKISLDEAFGMKSKQKVGNPAKQLDIHRNTEEFLFCMSQHLANNPSTTQEDAARACYIEFKDRDLIDELSVDDLETFIETMARYYRQEGWVNIEKSIKGERLKLDPNLKNFGGK